MTDTLLAAVIAGSVSMIGVVVSLIATWVSNASSRKKLQEEIRGEFCQFLYRERLECYGQAFEAAGKIIQRKAPEYINAPEELKGIARFLWEWSSSKAGLLMSGPAFTTLRELLDALSKRPAHNDRYSQDQAEKIWRLRSDFRRELRKDVLHLTPWETQTRRLSKQDADNA